MLNEESLRPTVLEVNLNNFKHNVNQIQSYVGNDVKLMPVIKAAAYGTYIDKCIDVINEFDIVAVAVVDEAVELRKLGYEKEIFLLNQAYKDEIDKIVKYNVTIGISSLGFLEELGKTGENVKIHIEIGTGMGRTGINPIRVEEYVKEVEKYPNIKVEGMYTHLSSADIDFEYTEKQLNSFKNAIENAKRVLGDLKYIHCSASNGILNFKDSYYNLVRPGMILYGYDSCEGAAQKLDLKPVCKLKSKVTFLKEVGENVSIGYSRSFITNRKTKVATIPIGYADGMKRAFSNKGSVVIKGKKVPIIGSVCMDSFMVDLTEIDDVNVGDDVYIWDNENITVDELAKLANTINYEIISTVSNRVPRVFIK